MQILYQGLLRSTASWARVGRGYIRALLSLGVEVSAVATRGFRYAPDFPLPEGLRELSASETRAGQAPRIGLGFVHPPLVSRLVGRKKANLFVWEADRVPTAWVADLDRGADRVIVPSTFNRDALVRSGFPAEKAVVVPYGHEVPEPEALRDADRPPRSAGGASRPPAGTFTLFTVVAPHERKGIRQLLRAYASAFRGEGGVLLRIKTGYDPGAARRRFPFEIPSWDQLLDEAGLRGSGAPPCEIDFETLTDEELLLRYLDADLYVQPSWGEGFGLALLDACAVGLPALATAWGGHMDYFPSGDNAIPYRLVEAGCALYAPVPEGRLAVPDETALASRLRWHRDRTEESRMIGASLRDRVAGWTWREAARRLLAVLEEM